MKILLLASGKDIHSVRWANALSQLGHEVHLCFNADQGPNQDKFDTNVVLHKLKFTSPIGYYLNVFQLKSLIKKIKPDILNIHYASGYGTLGRLSKFRPSLLSVYGSDVYDFPYKKPMNMKIIKKNLKFADAIASTSQAMAIQVTRLVNIPLNEINITPFGVDINKFKKNNEVYESNDIFTIGSIKKLSSKYGLKYGILAVNYLNKKLITNSIDIKIRYEIYGEGEEETDLKKLISEYGLDEIVELKGRIPNIDVPKALNNFDVFVGTSVLDSESFGVAIVEAMACEVPVIVSDVDGFKEVVDNGAAGIIYERKEYERLAEELYNLLLNKEECINLGQKARERVVREYNWADNVKKMENIYNKLLRKNG